MAAFETVLVSAVFSRRGPEQRVRFSKLSGEEAKRLCASDPRRSGAVPADGPLRGTTDWQFSVDGSFVRVLQGARVAGPGIIARLTRRPVSDQRRPVEFFLEL